MNKDTVEQLTRIVTDVWDCGRESGIKTGEKRIEFLTVRVKMLEDAIQEKDVRIEELETELAAENEEMYQRGKLAGLKENRKRLIKQHYDCGFDDGFQYGSDKGHKEGYDQGTADAYKEVQEAFDKWQTNTS